MGIALAVAPAAPAMADAAAAVKVFTVVKGGQIWHWSSLNLLEGLPTVLLGSSMPA